MSNVSHPLVDSRGLGATSLALGGISLLFFFMPVFGIPIGAVGLVLGVVSLVHSRARSGRFHGLPATGTGLSIVALIMNLALSGGLSGAFSGRLVHWPWR